MKMIASINVDTLSDCSMTKIYGGNGVVSTAGVNSDQSTCYDIWDTSTGYETDADFWDDVTEGELP